MRNLAYIAQRKPDPAEAPGDAFAAMSGESLDDVVIPQGQQAPGDDLNITETPEEIAAKQAAIEKANEGKTPEEIEAARIAEEEKAKAPILDADGNPIVKNEFTADDIEGDDGTPTEGDDEASWKDVGSLVGLELDDDSQEAFLEADKKRIENIKKEAIAEHLIKTQKMNPEAVRLVEAFNSGATELGIYKVEEPYRDFLALSAEDKIKQTLLSINHTEEHAQRIIDEHIENGTLDDEAERIDANVKGLMLGKVNEYFDGLKSTAVQQRQQNLDKIAQENKLVESAIMAREDFVGLKLSDDVKKKIITRWNNGTYRQAFESDPNAVVDFILERELGKKARDLSVSSQNRDFREGVQGKLQTLDQARQAAAASPGVSTKIREVDPKDAFSGWDSINEVQVETKTVYKR